MKNTLFLILTVFVFAFTAGCKDRKPAPFDTPINAESLKSFNESIEPARSQLSRMPDEEADRVAATLKYVAFDAYKKYPERNMLDYGNPESIQKFNSYAIKTFHGKTMNEVLLEYAEYKVPENENGLWEEFEKFLEVPVNP